MGQSADTSGNLYLLCEKYPIKWDSNFYQIQYLYNLARHMKRLLIPCWIVTCQSGKESTEGVGEVEALSKKNLEGTTTFIWIVYCQFTAGLL